MSPRTKEQISILKKEQEEKILRVALSVFSQKGVAETSIRDIATEARISVGLTYNYFDSKEALVFAVMQSAFKTLDETIVAFESEDPRENLKFSIERFIDLLISEKDKIRLLAQMGIHAKKLDQLNQITISKYEGSVSKFQQNLEKMGISNSKTEAKFLVATLDGIMFETLLMDEPFDLEEIKVELIKKYCK